MTILVELLAIAHGLYVLMGAVILLGGLAIFAVEAGRHLSRRNAQMSRPSAPNVYVNHLHIHVTPTAASGQGVSSPIPEDVALPEADTARAKRTES